MQRFVLLKKIRETYFNFLVFAFLSWMPAMLLFKLGLSDSIQDGIVVCIPVIFMCWLLICVQLSLKEVREIKEKKNNDDFSILVRNNLAYYINNKHLYSPTERVIIERVKIDYKNEQIKNKFRQAEIEKQKIAKEKQEVKRKEFNDWYDANMGKNTQQDSLNFYNSSDWRRLRYKAFKLYGNSCNCCGRSKKLHNIVLHVDHIKPRSIFPELALEIKNLQILCEDCNIAKSNTDQTTWR